MGTTRLLLFATVVGIVGQVTDDNDEAWETEGGGATLSGDGWLAAPEEGLLQVTVPVAGSPGWNATWVFEVFTRPPRPVELHVRPAKGAPPAVLTARTIRQLRIEDGLRACSARLRAEGADQLFGVTFDEQVLRRRPGRAGRGDYEYAALAAEYVDLCTAGDRSPVKTMAERHAFSRSQINNLISEARRRELLTREGAGRVGGSLTRKAMEVLERGQR